jgi:hypothetical protein
MGLAVQAKRAYAPGFLLCEPCGAKLKYIARREVGAGWETFG